MKTDQDERIPEKEVSCLGARVNEVCRLEKKHFFNKPRGTDQMIGRGAKLKDIFAFCFPSCPTNGLCFSCEFGGQVSAELEEEGRGRRDFKYLL